MEIKKLYKFKRADGGVTISPNQPECEYEENFRLIAEENMALTRDNINFYNCIDVDTNIEEWKEVYHIELP